ncbi:MAG: translocation/assembly module TamB domain-containing protein [Granulosicoccus sp.]
MLRLLRWSGWLALGTGVLLLLLCVPIFLLTVTDAGFSRLSGFIDKRVDELAFEGVSGNLGTGLSVQTLEYNNNGLRVQANGLSSEWQPRCFLQRRVCLDSLNVEQLVLNLPPAANTPSGKQRPKAVELRDISLPFDIQASDIHIEELQLNLADGDTQHVINNIHLSADATGSLLTIDDASLKYRGFTSSLTGSIELTDDYPLSLLSIIDTPDVRQDTTAAARDRQPLQILTSFSDSLEKLTINSTLSGIINATVTGFVEPLERKLPATATLASDLLSWPFGNSPQYSAADTRIQINGDLDDFQLQVSTQISGETIPAAALNVSGYINPTRITLPQIQVSTLDGTAQGSLLASLGNPVVWSTSLNIENMNPSGLHADLDGALNGAFEISGRLENRQWSLNVQRATIDGQLQGYPFMLDSQLMKGMNDIWFIRHLRLNNGENQVSAKGVISDTWNVNADIDLPQLQNLIPQLNGSFKSTIDIGGELNTPDIRLSASSETMSYAGNKGTGLYLEADIDQLFEENSRVKLVAESVQIAGNTVENATAELTGTRSGHEFIVQADGPRQSAVELLLNGTLQDEQNWTGLLRTAMLKLHGHDLRLSDPTELGWSHEQRQFHINAHCWASDDATLCLKDRVVAATDGVAQLTLDDYELSRLNSLLTTKARVAGDLSATVDMTWGESTPGGVQAVVDTTVRQGSAQIDDARGVPLVLLFEQLSALTTLNPEQIESDLSLTSESLGQADVSVALNPSDSTAPMTGTIALDGLNLDTLQPLLPEVDELSGGISAEGAISGKPTAPRFNGSVAVKNTVLRSELIPLPITGGELAASFTGQTLSLEGELLSDNGAIELSGSASIKPEQWFAKLRLLGSNLKVRRDPVQDSTINHDILISANSSTVNVRGNIGVPMAVVDVAELPEGAATVSDDVIVVEDEQNTLEREAMRNATNLNVQVNVGLGDDVRLSAYGLTARLEGDVDVRLRAPNPVQLGGEITLVDGIYRQYGQDLEASGQVLFVGPVDNTRLAIDAVREIDQENREAGVRIQGTAKNPEITLFTEPADKSEDAILSYIVLGRDINEASDQDANLLAAAALALTVRGGRSVAGGVAEALGLEELDLETQGSGDDTELVVSGRVNDRLLLKYGQDVFGSESTLYFRYDLTQKLYLEAARGAERAVDLFYSFSF